MDLGPTIFVKSIILQIKLKIHVVELCLVKYIKIRKVFIA